jgi:methylated-DNA-[protein]-cysteine S-methyltransferase
MRCEIVSKNLDRYRTEELSTRLKVSIENHLTNCRPCSAKLVDLNRLAADIGLLRAAAPPTLTKIVMESAMDRYGPVETEVGKVWIGFNTRGITMVYPGAQGAPAFSQAYLSRRFRVAQPASVPRYYANLVRQAASGTPLQNPRLDLDGLTPFEQATLGFLLHIPRGEVRPYSWLAREVGKPRAVRAVGTAMARNPVPLLLPCHRVVPADGGVGNYAFGSEMKKVLLQREGVPLEELDSLAQNGVRYLGCKSTGIYCFPTCCNARRMKPENRLFFSDASRAEESGYRPCRHCKP